MKKFAFVMTMVALVGLQGQAHASSILLTAENFAVLGGSAITNTGPTTITGDMGLHPGTAITGYESITHTGSAHQTDAAALQAQTDLTKAYVGLEAMPFNFDLTGVDLGGQILTSGVYKFGAEAQLTGTLKLDAQGLDNAFWVFQIGSELTTASNSAVALINAGGAGGTFDGLFWQVGSSATLGTSTDFEGNILALTSITLNTGATIHNGRALARNGAVTMDSNTIDINSPYPNLGTMAGGLEYDVNGNVVPGGATAVPDGATAVPEPCTMILFASGMAVIAFKKRLHSRLSPEFKSGD